MAARRSSARVWLPQLLPFIFFLVTLLFATQPPLTTAQPIRVPNLRKCELAFDRSVAPPIQTLRLNCCLPIPPQSAVHFSPRKYPTVPHVRQAAHRVSEAYIAKYNRAYELMKALPNDDPRSFYTQANIHCAFCNFAYRQKGNSSVPLQVHFSWLFLPWHRWYLYFHERILQNLLGDPTFSLVFWNWDDQRDGGNVLPAMFARNGTALFDEKRNPNATPPAIVELVVRAGAANTSALIEVNLNAVHDDVVIPTTAELFEGGRYVTGTDLTNATVINAPLGGSIENGIHNAIHFWTGDPNLPLLQDMGTFSTASRDPIFYAHHSNVDRLWDVWKYHLPGGPRADHDDPDFLNAEFYFYDELARLVRVKVRDALDNSKLGISYPNVSADQLWINYTPNVTTNGSAVAVARALGVRTVSAYPDNGVVPLGSRLAAIVKRSTLDVASATTSTSTAPDKQEVLVIQGLRITRDSFTSVHAFVNMPTADFSTPTNRAEYLGAFNIIPTASVHRNLVTNVKFAIGTKLKRIGIHNDPEVVITLAVQGSQPITIEGLLIHYE